MRARLVFAAILSVLMLASISYAEDNFAGVGLVLAVQKQTLTIIHVLPDTPASRAGLSEGLLVQKIDGMATEGKPLKDCVDLIRGAAGTKVQLQLVNTSERKTNTVELVRETIPVR